MAWETLSTLGPDFRCQVIDFIGEQVTIQLNREIVHQALHLQEWDLQYSDIMHKDEDKDLCANVLEPRWDQLNCQAIQLPLQLHMQHLHVSNPHRWSMPEKAVVVEYTLKQMQRPELKKDYAGTFLYKLLRGSKSNVTKGASKSTRKTRPYLGAVLPLTRIIYHALGETRLPKPWVKPEDARTGSKMELGSRPAQKTKKPKTPKKPDLVQRKPTTRSRKSQEEKSLASGKDQRTEEEEEEDMLLEALELSKSRPSSSSRKTPSTVEEKEDADLREALRRIVYETHISQQGTTEKFFTSTKGEMYIEKDMATIREVLIEFSQDPKVVLGLHKALGMLREERNKYLEKIEAQREAEEEKVRKKKKADYERSMKDSTLR